MISKAFRSSDYLRGNERVRYQLDDFIRSPGNNQHQHSLTESDYESESDSQLIFQSFLCNIIIV